MRDTMILPTERRQEEAMSATVGGQTDAEALIVRGRAAIRAEASALLDLAYGLDGHFAVVAALIAATQGLVVVSGVGKSRLVGARLSATLAATGTPSTTLHPTEALHGDLGRLRSGDLLMVLSNSGETPEVMTLIGAARAAIPGLAVVAITSSNASSIARAADVAVSIGKNREVCSLGLAPTTSAVVMAALGDAIAVAVAAARGFTMHDFARLHPGGHLGHRINVTQSMQPEVDRPTEASV
jgi:arabinose-5-phosphate isomerase